MFFSVWLVFKAGRCQIILIKLGCKASYSSPFYTQTFLSWLNEGTTSLLITFRSFSLKTVAYGLMLSHTNFRNDRKADCVLPQGGKFHQMVSPFSSLYTLKYCQISPVSNGLLSHGFTSSQFHFVLIRADFHNMVPSNNTVPVHN